MLVFKATTDCGVRTLKEVEVRDVLDDDRRVPGNAIDGSPSLHTKTLTGNQGLAGKGSARVRQSPRGVRTMVPVRMFPGTVTGTVAQSWPETNARFSK